MVVGSLIAFAGCQPVDAHFDCTNVCQKYHDCFDDGYDVSSCVSRCQSNATNNDNYYVTVNNCDSCIAGKSCGNATFSCGGECSNVVP